MTHFVGRRAGGSYELVVFDLRVSGATERMISEGAAWRGGARVEFLSPGHAVLVVRAGEAARVERRAA
ncbi:MAG: hypothetical protein ACRDSJ_00130 [Rubrobacteraceae bacterium]